MSDIFISYHNSDRERAKQLAESLETFGWSVWWDREIPPGRSFEDVIREAIEATCCMVVCWSAASVKSDWVKDEAREGRNRGILVPVTFDGHEPPMGYGQIHMADLAQWKGGRQHENFKALINEIESRLSNLDCRDESLSEFKPVDSPKITSDTVRPSRSKWWMMGAGALLGTCLAIALVFQFHNETCKTPYHDAVGKGVYEGACKDAVPSGEGVITFLNGDIYEGNVKYGLINGYGAMAQINGQRYVGLFKGRTLNGQGTATWPDGKMYVGEFKGGKEHGQGTLTWPSGNKYVGEFQDGNIQGQGTFTWQGGIKYVGELKDGKQSGQGTLTWPDGKMYVGEFQGGDLQGQGTFTWPDGKMYEGEFQDDHMHGQGTLTWPGGNKYVGEVKDDKAHGAGTRTWPDGTTYVGEWLQSKMTGKGVCTRPGGKPVNGSCL